jgi:uncharacterized cupin superfamily protein
MTDTLDRLQGARSTLGMKTPVRVATTANITLSGLQAIDGITVAENDRVLVKDQTDETENGPYAASSGEWSRTKDFDGSGDFVQGTLVPVAAGTANVGTVWRVSSAAIDTIGEDDITFAQLDFTSVEVSADIATGSSINLSSTDAEIINVTGSGATITAITLADGKTKIVRFEGANTLTHSSTLVLPGAQNITTAAGDFAIFCGYASSVVRCAGYSPGSSQPLVTGAATIASAATVELGSVREQIVTISGSTAVTSFGSTAITGTVKFCRLSGAVPITASASIITPGGGGSIQGASGDSFIAQHEGSGVWRIVNYTRATFPADISTTDTSNAAVTESDLISFSLPASRLASSGAAIRVRGWGVATTASTAATRRLRLYFGSAVIADTGARDMASHWSLEATVVRTSGGANTQKSIGTGVASTGATGVVQVVAGSPTEATTAAVTIKITGLCTAATGIITANGLSVEQVSV